MKKLSSPSNKPHHSSPAFRGQSHTTNGQRLAADHPEAQPAPPAPALPVAHSSRPRATRTGVIWVAMVCGLLLLILLIVFIAQNQTAVTLQYFGWSGPVSLGLTLFISAVAGGLVIAIVAVARITQLRATTAAQRKKLNHGGI